MKTVILLSGGMKSATLALDRREAGDLLFCLSFDYGQWNAVELEAARRFTDRFGLRHSVVKLDPVVELVGNDPALPNRDLLFLAIAYGWASVEGCDAVAYGVAAGAPVDFVREATPRSMFSRESRSSRFVDGIRELMPNSDAGRAALLAPYVSWSREGVVRHGLELEVPFVETYSCDNGEPIHCGTCSACLSRRAAFVSIGELDPTVYASEPQS